ncbi:MAG: prephenate dehydratase [Microbacteriaceae bacterium]|jgi:prephenate dehydratase/chorismate mutase/prephenate dehydratase|nr:prephenate dehydratase [Microbacteriaceae bacterium]
MTVLAFLGPLGTFTHEAARRFAAAPEDLRPETDIDAVYDAVEQGRADRAVVALDNTVEGLVIPSLNRLLSGSVFALDRTDVLVSFCAVRRADDPGPARVAVSHPHALAQCRAFVQDHGLETRTADSTARACQELSPGEVAIAPKICAEVYGLRIEAEHIQDYAGARTTFLSLMRSAELSADRVAAVPQPAHTLLAVTPRRAEIGCLTRILAGLSDRHINIFSLSSRPVKAAPGAYTFLLDVNGAPGTFPLRDTMQEWLDAGDFLKILGVYPWSPHDELTVSPISETNMLPGSFTGASIPAAFAGCFTSSGARP